MVEHVSHVERTKVYVAVWIILLCFTALTTGVAYIDLGSDWNTVVALAIAVCKASIVVLFFMHVRNVSERMVRVVIITAIFTLLVLIVVTLSDTATRQLIPAPPGIRRATHMVYHHLGESK
jgi:cytochrome c oxidase subunit IV